MHRLRHVKAWKIAKSLGLEKRFFHAWVGPKYGVKGIGIVCRNPDELYDYDPKDGSIYSIPIHISNIYGRKLSS